LAPRLAVLIAALAFAGCLKAPSAARPETGCRSCHAAHYVREGACSDCHRGDPAAEREELAHEKLLAGRAAAHRLPDSLALREGRRLAETLACRRCHVIGGKGNRLATELDAVVWTREQRDLVASIRQPVAGMPRFSLDEPQAEALVAYLLRSGRPDGAEDAYRVHFSREADVATSVFERECGPCHRTLTRRGAFGAGDAGPNLSGLFTEHYPRTAPGERRWDEKALVDWLRNPRRARAHTTMRPVSLSEADLQALLAELR
jgi:cytochrome c2